MDNFRRPKTSYYLYTSQRDAAIKLTYADSGPMVYIAHELTPFSDKDIIVFTNCDQVRLTMPEKDPYTQHVQRQGQSLPNPPVVFKDVYNFDDWLTLTRKTKDKSTLNIIAEGLIDGKVVAMHKRTVARNVTNIKLSVEGNMFDSQTGKLIVLFEDEREDKNKNLDYKQLGYIIGQDIGKFILSGEL